MTHETMPWQAKIGRRLGNWNDRVNGDLSKSLAAKDRRWKVLNRIAGWLYTWGQH